MKLSKTTGLLILIGTFIVIGSYLGMDRFQQVEEQNELNEKLAQVQANLGRVNLENVSSRQAELKKQLSEATSQLEAVRAAQYQPVGSTDIVNILFDTAKANGVEVIQMDLPSPTSATFEGVTCSALSLTARVDGDILNLVRFTTELNSHFTIGYVKSITITIPETGSDEKASADIQLVVYTYQEG